MERIQVTDDITIEIPDAEVDLDSVILFGPPKSGTTLLNAIFADFCKYTKVMHLGLDDILWRNGVVDFSRLNMLRPVFKTTGYCFGCHRHLHSYITSEALRDIRKILILRDPRDMLVSDYFSMAYSHPVPKGQEKEWEENRRKIIAEDINDYVLERADLYKHFIKQWVRLKKYPGLKVYQYQDIIYNKSEWIDDLLAFVNWTISPEAKAHILEKNDVFPDAEDVKQHIRNVHPGNHKEKLKPETIARLNQVFARVCAEFEIDLA